jgi:MYXO-CTERM domain-containing protein
MKKLLLLAAMVMLTTAPASAASTFLGLDPTPWNTDNAVILTVTPTAPGQQVTNLPCIICGAHQPQQPALFGYNLFGNTGNETTVSFFSTAVVPPGPGSGLAIDQFAGATGYSLLPGAPLLTAIGGFNGFSIGVDSNQAGTDAQTLESFWFLNLTTHTVLGVFSPTPNDGYDITPLSNGTGFPDFTINGLTLAGVSAGDQIMFFARITGANDGPDSFFLIPNAAAETPLPAAVWLFGSAVAGGAFMLRRRKNKVAAQVAA